MTAEKMFEKVIRNKVRFPTSQGMLNVEQLYDISEDVFNHAYTALLEQVETQKVDLFKRGTPATEKNTLMLEVMQHVAKTRLDEEEARQQAILDKMEKEQELKQLMKRKSAIKNEKVDALTEAEVNKRLAELM